MAGIDLSKLLGLGTTGTWTYGGFTLPDFGLTETRAPSSPTPTLFYNPAAWPTGQSTSSTPPKTTTTTPPGGSPTGSPAAKPTGDTGGGGGPVDTSGMSDAEKKAYEEQTARLRAAIGAEFEPVFSELDRQAGVLPEQQKQLDDLVTQLATSQGADVADTKTKNLSTLGESQTEEEDLAKANLRQLGEDVSNQLKARSYYFGSVGAGDSSATGEASDIIYRQGLKARGGVMTALQDAVSTIKGKMADVETMATSQLRKIDDWKSTKLVENAQFIKGKIDDLAAQRVNATAEKAKAITNMISGLASSFLTRLQQLDDTVINYKNTVNLWKEQRVGELQDYESKLAIAAKYGGSGAAYGNARASFTQTLNPVTGDKATVSGLTPEQLQGILTTGQVSGTTKKKDASLNDLLSGVVPS